MVAQFLETRKVANVLVLFWLPGLLVLHTGNLYFVFLVFPGLEKLWIPEHFNNFEIQTSVLSLKSKTYLYGETFIFLVSRKFVTKLVFSCGIVLLLAFYHLEYHPHIVVYAAMYVARSKSVQW